MPIGTLRAQRVNIVNYPTLHPLSYRNKIGDKFGDATTVTVWEKLRVGGRER